MRPQRLPPSIVGGRPESLKRPLQGRGKNLPYPGKKCIRRKGITDKPCIGPGLIERTALFQKGCKALARSAYHSPFIEISQTFFKEWQRKCKVQYKALGGKALHGFSTVDHTAPRGDDRMGYLNIPHMTGFDFPEGLKAFLLNDFRKPHFFKGLNEKIRIQKIHAQHFCGKYAQGAFTRTGHTDEDEVDVGKIPG